MGVACGEAVCFFFFLLSFLFPKSRLLISVKEQTILIEVWTLEWTDLIQHSSGNPKKLTRFDNPDEHILIHRQKHLKLLSEWTKNN